MNRLLTLLCCLGVFLGTAAAWVWLDRRLDQRLEQLERDATRDSVSKTSSSSEESDAAALERRRRFAKELELAMGGPTESRVKDPALGIGDMLRELATLTLPAGSRVVVSVDRFTEFLVVAELPRVASYAEMATWSQILLKPGSRYLHLVRFVHDGLVIGELDRSKIETLGDWKSVELSKVAESIQKTTDLELGVGESRARVVDLSPGLPEDLNDASPNGDDSPLSVSQRQSNDYFRSQVALLIQLLQESGKSVNLSLLITKTSTQSQLDQLGAAAKEFDRLQVLLRDPSQDLDRRLRAANVDDVLRVATVRGEAQDYGARVQSERLFDALKRYLESLRKFIQTLDANRELWSVHNTGVTTVQFSDPGVDVLYQKALRDCERCRETVDRCWIDWSQEAWSKRKAAPQGDGRTPKAPAATPAQ